MKRTAPLPTTLNLTPTPFRSSRVAVPPSPFSPLSPLSPLRPRFPTTQHNRTTSLIIPPPPPQPLKWLWQCHLCSRIYALGTTRRCLDDGHYFCAGTPVWKRDRKTGKRSCKKGRACASEFDYAGWKARGEWRRDVASQVEMAALPRGEQITRDATAQPTKKNCWANCDYPSECRWGKQFGVSQGAGQDIGVAVTKLAAVSEPTPSTTFDDILSNSTAVSDSQDITLPDAPPLPERKPSLDDVVSSAQRRKRRSTGAPPSPLASHPPAPEMEMGPLIVHAVNPPRQKGERDIADEVREHDTSAHALQKAFDEFELDVRKGLGKAGEIWNGLLGGRKPSKGV